VPDDIPQISSSSFQFDHDCRPGGMQQFQQADHNHYSDGRNAAKHGGWHSIRNTTASDGAAGLNPSERRERDVLGSDGSGSTEWHFRYERNGHGNGYNQLERRGYYDLYGEYDSRIGGRGSHGCSSVGGGQLHSHELSRTALLDYGD